MSDGIGTQIKRGAHVQHDSLSSLEVPLKVGGGRGGLNVLPCAKVSTIQLRAFEQYSI